MAKNKLLFVSWCISIFFFLNSMDGIKIRKKIKNDKETKFSHLTSDNMQPLIPIILSHCSLQSIGRLGQVCKTLGFWNFAMLPKNSVCFSELRNSYSRCSQALLKLAKQDKKKMFFNLFSYHKDLRIQELDNFYSGVTKFSEGQIICAYADDYEKIRKKSIETLRDVLTTKEKRIKLTACLRICDDIDGFSLFGQYGYDPIERLLVPARTANDVIGCVCKQNKVEPLIALMGQYIKENPGKTMDSLMRNGKISIVLSLIKRGLLDVDIRNESEKSILHLHHVCCCNGYTHALIQLGADINALDKKGRTPLHYACMWLDLNFVKKLLKYKSIRIDIKDKKGKTSFDMVDHCHGSRYENNKRTIRNLLKGHGYNDSN